MKSEKITFRNRTGANLGARVDLPDLGNPDHFALFAHCFTCTKNIKTIGHINRALTNQGIAVLRFDFTGLGESEGDFTETNFTTNVQDLISAAEFLEKEYSAPRLIMGHSLGGAAVLQAASSIPSSVAVVTIATPSDPGHLKRLLRVHPDKIEQDGFAEISIAGRSFKVKKQFFEDLEGSRMEERVQHLNRALLILHSPADRVVGIENAARIFQAARHPKSFVSLDDADHLLLDEADGLYVGGLISAWARRYLEKSTRKPTQ
ncbi:MAG: osmotically inducible protein OsmC [Spirochaetes bacterium DG_61]|nr:MAG: osmotically inducible protein OsmC [Spirochaetes bacterium DG_61]